MDKELVGFGEMSQEEIDQSQGEEIFSEESLEHQYENSFDDNDNGSEGDPGEGNDDDLDLDENGNPIDKAAAAAAAASTEDDITDDDLKEVFGEEGSKGQQEPGKLMDQLKDVLGIEVTEENPLNEETLVNTVKNLISADQDDEISTLKKFKALNPEASIYDFKARAGAAYAEALALDNRTLYVEYLVAVEKKSDEEARREAAEAVSDGVLEDKVKPIREQLQNKKKEAFDKLKAEIEQEKTKRNEIALENQKKLFYSMKDNRERFGGLFKATKNDVIETMKFVKEGGLEKAIKDPEQASDIAYFLKNKETIFKVMRSNMFEEGKALILEKLELSSKEKNTRQPSKRGSGNDEW